MGTRFRFILFKVTCYSSRYSTHVLAKVWIFLFLFRRLLLNLGSELEYWYCGSEAVSIFDACEACGHRVHIYNLQRKTKNSLILN